jgi:serine/threonine protein phosphatase PrpC
MNCPSCGNENRLEAKFCRFCGSTLPAIEQSGPEPQPIDIHADATIVPHMPAQPVNEDPYATLIVDPAELFDPLSTPGYQPVTPPEALPSEPKPISPEIPPVEATPGAPVEIMTGEAPAETVTSDAFEDTAVPAIMIPLSPGTVLAERYRITNLMTEEPGALVYQAEDLRLCWSCGVEQSDPDPRFCEMCGMELTSHPVITLRQTQLPLEGTGIFQFGDYTYQVEPGVEVAPPASPVQVPGYFAGYASDTGRQRDIDEDSVLALQLAGLCNRCSGPTLGFFAVADGIGGQDAGEVASRTTIRSLAANIMQQVFLPAIANHNVDWIDGGLEDLFQGKLIQAVSTANQTVIDLRLQSLTGSNMGCTLTAALLYDQICVVANVGDSRTYRMHGSQLTQITRDHSVVANMIEAGEITSAQALEHDRKGVIYRCLGDLPELEIDTFLLELEIGDRLLLCCDGLWEMVPEGLIEDILLQYMDPQAACQKLVSLANEAGGEDNISVIVINIQSVT